jgi:hypothetical protein
MLSMPYLLLGTVGGLIYRSYRAGRKATASESSPTAPPS